MLRWGSHLVGTLSHTRAFIGEMRKRICQVTLFLGAVAACIGCLRTGKVGTTLARACEACGKPIVVGQQVTLLTEKGERHVFRCVHCALVHQEARYPDSTFRARSAQTGKDIRVLRRGQKWRTRPETAVFLILPEADGECLDRHKVFTNERELRSYLARHRGLANLSPKTYTIRDLREMLGAGLPHPSASR